MLFKNREEAGFLLANRLREFIDNQILKDPIVIALPRGGVPIGVEISKELNIPFDIYFVKKIPSPMNKEVAIGSISEGGEVYLNRAFIDRLNLMGIRVDEEYINQEIVDILQDIARKRDKYKIEPLDIEGKDVILVDDGVATGASIYLAAKSLRNENPRSITIAVPVAPNDKELFAKLKEVADNLVILYTPSNFQAVGQWYEDFHQLSDKEVKELIKEVRP